MKAPAPTPEEARVTVCIPTHNREEDLRRTLAEIAHLEPPPDEILVLLDGCTDGSETFVRTEYPQVRLLRRAPAGGSVTARNLLFREASHDLLLNIDDDSYPLERDAIARLRALFGAHPRLAAASFPQRTNEFPESLTATDFGPPVFPASYVNCASALRRRIFLEQGGYTPEFFHAYDEPEFCLRCLEAGYEVRFHPGLTIRHHFTPAMRSELRTHHRHARNEFWSILLRAPWWLLGPVAFFRVVRQAGYARQRGFRWLWQEPRWWGQALAGAGAMLARRRPVSARTYLGWLRLLRRPARSEAEWRQTLGRPAEEGAA